MCRLECKDVKIDPKPATLRYGSDVFAPVQGIIKGKENRAVVSVMLSSWFC